jgi:citrate lyase subunit beta/citryl-CoA lyase
MSASPNVPVVALFVPGDRPDRFAKAVAAADIAIVDLEDAVAPDRKEHARSNAVAAVRGALHAWVRMNALTTPYASGDLEALASAPPAGVLIPKVSCAGDVHRVRAAVAVPLIALIESVAGVRHLDEIAGSGCAIVAFGAYDLCAELGARPTAEVLATWRAQVVLATRAAGIAALDTPFVELDKTAELEADARRAVDFGFDGKLAIHPNQVAVIRDAFRPSPAELERARAIVAAAASGGVHRFAGTMIDEPLVQGARRVIARAERFV